MKTYNLKVNGKEYKIDIESLNEYNAQVKCNGADYKVEFETSVPVKEQRQLDKKPVIPDTSEKKTYSPGESSVANAIKAPIPGLITKILVSEGDIIKGGQVVAKMEAMKMENNILASADGKVSQIAVKAGETVLEGDILIRMEEA
jgi:glutaconyl-CoA/methylmalonyl-CoA decarboxylase subunit gamma